MKVNNCIKTLDVYREKLDKSKELCCAIEDSDEDLVSEILTGILCEQVISRRIELGEFDQ